MSVRNLAMPVQFFLIDEVAGSNRNVVLPEDVVRKPDDSPKKGERFTWRACVGEGMRIRGHSYKSALGQRTRCPSGFPIPIEPPQRRPVMNVIRPGKRDQQIDVQESNHDSLCVQRVLNQLDCDWGSIRIDIEDRKPRLCL
jgi:hypothetical protein